MSDRSESAACQSESAAYQIIDTVKQLDAILRINSVMDAVRLNCDDQLARQVGTDLWIVQTKHLELLREKLVRIAEALFAAADEEDGDD